MLEYENAQHVQRVYLWLFDDGLNLIIGGGGVCVCVCVWRGGV